MTFYAAKQPSPGGFFSPIVGYKGGKGGGGSARTPIEDPDSLHGKAFARILDMWSEGDIYGPTHGGDGLRDFILDGTRVKNEDGSVNLPGVTVDMRMGTQAQEPIPGFPSSENTIGIGVELKAATPWLRSFTDIALSAVRVNLQTTQYEVKPNGDRVGYRIEYALDVSTDGGPFLEVFVGAFDGKTTSAYPRSHRVELPRASSNWRVRVRRLTADSTSDLITSITRIESIVEIIDARLRYPLIALGGSLIDASLFSAVPQRAYDLMGRIVRVPSNYDAFNHTYFGTWDGTFKLSWTDNPAWIFYDLVTNDRYGLGHLVPLGLMDKWSLFQIGQYCDESVPDGFGGTEPRFTCNVYLQEAADAYRVLQDLAGCFRGMAFPAGGSIFASADIPSDPSDWYSFSNSNVRDGKFNYPGTSRTSRFTVAQVSWNDLDDMGRQKVEVVEDQEAIARYGIRSTSVTAFGCTSQGQAHRVGKWLLMTSLMETGTVIFQTALEQARVMPGKVIRVADQHRAGRRIGGRIAFATASVVTVDMAIGVRPGDRLVVNLPSGITQERIVQTAQGQYLTADQTTWTVDSTDITTDMIGMPGSTLIIRVTQPFTEVPQSESQWTLESEDLSYQTFRVLRIERKGELWAEIIGVEHNPSKYAAIDYGTKLQTKPITIIPPMVQAAPTGISISGYSVIEQGYATHTAVIQWQPVANAVAYIVEWRRDNSDWLPAGRTGASSIEVRGIFAGAYVARVRAVNGMEITSNWAYSIETQLDGFTGAPPVLSFLNAESAIFGINLTWGFPDVPSIIGKTEIWMSAANNVATAQKIDFGYPTNTYMLLGLAPDTELFFWGRLVDKNGLPGAFYPDTTNGVRGVSRHDAAGYLAYYNGLLNRDSLALSMIQELDTLAAGIGDFTTQITQERELRESADEALASQVDTIAAVANGAAGSIVEERTARTDADETLALSIDTVRAANVVTAAQVDTERTARIQGDTAVATSVDQVRATANGAQAGVNQTSTALASLDGRLQATYTMRAQVNQFGQVYAAAMGLGVYDAGQGLQSSIYFLAERFAFVNNANGVLTTPFVIEGGITYINRAMIGNAWITSAKIESLDAGKVTFGEMSGDRIEVNTLAAKLANVGTAYIGTANIKVANVDTLRLAGMSVVVAASGDAGQEYGNATGNNTVSLSIQVPYACTLLVVYEVRIGGIAAQQNEPAYIGGNFMPNRGLKQVDFKPNSNGDGGSITTGYQNYVTQAGLSGPLQFSVAGVRAGGTSQIFVRIAMFAIMR